MDGCRAGHAAGQQVRVHAMVLERVTEQAALPGHVRGGRGKEGTRGWATNGARPDPGAGRGRRKGLGWLRVVLEREKERVFQRKILFHF